MRKLLAVGGPAITHEFGIHCDPAWLEQPDISSEDHYQWRRDAEGLSDGELPRLKQPPADDELLAHFHLLLRKEGGQIEGSRYKISNRVVRVVKGSGRFLSTMKHKFEGPPAANNDDIIVCVGSRDHGLKDNVLRSGLAGDIVRTEPMSQFVTEESARELLGI